MSAFSEHKDELEHFQTMMGPHRGALAVTLDLQAEIGKAKELIQSVMENMRAERDAAGEA
jgi:hypothetical protein